MVSDLITLKVCSHLPGFAIIAGERSVMRLVESVVWNLLDVRVLLLLEYFGFLLSLPSSI